MIILVLVFFVLFVFFSFSFGVNNMNIYEKIPFFQKKSPMPGSGSGSGYSVGRSPSRYSNRSVRRSPSRSSGRSARRSSGRSLGRSFTKRRNSTSMISSDLDLPVAAMPSTNDAHSSQPLVSQPSFHSTEYLSQDPILSSSMQASPIQASPIQASPIPMPIPSSTQTTMNRPHTTNLFFDNRISTEANTDPAYMAAGIVHLTDTAGINALRSIGTEWANMFGAKGFDVSVYDTLRNDTLQKVMDILLPHQKICSCRMEFEMGVSNIFHHFYGTLYEKK